MRGLVVAVWLVGGCGRFGFDSDRAVDAAVDTADAFDPALVPWRTPTTNLGLGLFEEDPSVTADLLTLVWSSSRPGGVGGYDLWMGTRSMVGEPFGNLTNLSILNTTFGEYSPELSADGQTLYFTSDRADTGDVFMATRTGGTWSAPTLATDLSRAGNYDGDLALSPDGLIVVIVHGSGFFRGTRASTSDPFGPLVSVPELDISTDDASPTLGDGGRVIYFHAFAPRDIYVARLEGATYSTPVPVPELDTAAAREADPFISGDERYMIYNCSDNLCETTKP